MAKMSRSPATPEKLKVIREGDSGARVGYSGTMSASKEKHQNLIIEPSPASTYGETAAGDSIPATPQENVLVDLGAHAHAHERSTESGNIAHLLRVANRRGQESPTAKLSHDARRANEHSQIEIKGKVDLMNDGVSIHRYGAKLTSKIAHAPSASSPSSLCGHLKENTLTTPSKRRMSFVLQSKTEPADDPFTSSGQQTSAVKHELENSHSGSHSTKSNRSGYSEKEAITLESGQESRNAAAEPISPRADRTKEPISAENAQAVLPPSACVFVANLASVRTDEQLERSVMNVFEQFGTVYVKIRRDTRGMPYAFCQYERDDDARRAIMGGRRKLIDGRPCRTEPAKVNRSLYMSRLTGGKITEGDARRVLQPFGPVECVWWSSKTEREMYQLPEGIWVKFAYFQDCRDAQGAFREDALYRLEQPPTPPEFSYRTPSKESVSNHRGPWVTGARGRGSPRKPHDPAPREEVDRRSIFVGHLPEGTTKERLIEVFSQYGRIVAVDLVAKPAAHRSGYNTFAFIEYSLEEEATRAIQGQHMQIFDGNMIRVERKDSSDAGHRRAQLQDTPVAGPGYAGLSIATLEAVREQFRQASVHLEYQRQQILRLGRGPSHNNVHGATHDNPYGSNAPVVGSVPQSCLNPPLFGANPGWTGVPAIAASNYGHYADPSAGQNGYNSQYNINQQGQEHHAATATNPNLQASPYHPYYQAFQQMGQYQYPHHPANSPYFYHYSSIPAAGGSPVTGLTGMGPPAQAHPSAAAVGPGANSPTSLENSALASVNH